MIMFGKATLTCGRIFALGNSRRRIETAAITTVTQVATVAAILPAEAAPQERLSSRWSLENGHLVCHWSSTEK